jgi:outer membrane protein assembly factor BamB
VPPVPGQAILSIGEGKILATTGNFFVPYDSQMEVAYDMWTGQQLWIQNRETPTGTTSFGMMSYISNGVYTQFDKGALQFRGFSIANGQQIWGPTERRSGENAFASQPQEYTGAYGNLYQRAMDGIHVIDIQTGQRQWDFYADSTGLDYPGIATYPFLAAELTIADGIVFAATGNSHSDPLFSGAQLYAIDAYSGNELWNINGFFLGNLPIADGYLIGHNGYDNQIYCFGKGQTATTVTASPKISISGSSILIEGTITDQSPGAQGTPAISDDYMSEWMEYLYMQKPCPMIISGVDVKLETLDPNGNFYEIGTITSDASGMYKLMWEPPVPGEYTIIATFEGSESYFSSYAETAIGVEEASSAGGPLEPEPTEPTEAPLITTELAVLVTTIIVAIAVIAGIWIIRRRK